MDWHIALAGLVVGTLVGFSGVGSSSIMMPILVLLLRVHPLIAVGTDLAYSLPTKIVGAWVHRGQGTINAKLVILLAIGGIPGAIVGILSLGYVKHHVSLDQLNIWLKHFLAILMFSIAAIMIVSQFVRRRRAEGKAWVPLRPRAHIIMGLGLVVGFLVSVTSIGAGSITLTALLFILPSARLQSLVGSDVAFAALIIPIAALGHFTLGSIDFHLTWNLLLGSVPGVIIGSKLCTRLPDKVVRPAIAGMMVLAGAKMF
ncbi:MAG: sulfite exporter TauE/SafE family protein [Candidatus Eremiobacteraeota bacterium]|nr:sulfite exporter TauE/SafE family protein [Candidatus Eremiobacteraeota bacterium]MBC5826900.1 sulfite exporter TauE/SafE family protein [Candidatus Eremiobacteraeota bacterium]